MLILKHPLEVVHVQLELNSKEDFILKEVLFNDKRVSKFIDDQVGTFLFKNDYRKWIGYKNFGKWIKTPPDEIILSFTLRCPVRHEDIDNLNSEVDDE